jgi:hypothetical protein
VTLADRDPAAAPGPTASLPRVPWLLLLLLLAGSAALFLYASRPRLSFTNRLAAPVRLVVGSRRARTLAPGEQVTLITSGQGSLVAEWEMVRPLSADGTPMGEVVRGAVTTRGTRGSLQRAAGSRTDDADYFAPLITNTAGMPLRVTVNAGLAGAVDCGCAVRPGARRVFIGYYRLYQNSTVQARGPRGSATFRDLGPQVRAADGSLGLRFEDRDLR